jgi:hypothetical protein
MPCSRPCQRVKSTLSPFQAHSSFWLNITIVWYILYRGIYRALTSVTLRVHSRLGIAVEKLLDRSHADTISWL